MKSDIKRQTESAVGRISSKAPRKVNLPFSEAELLVGLDAHADALARPSTAETDE